MPTDEATRRNRARLKKAAHRARNISDPAARAIAQRKVKLFAKELLDDCQ